MVLAVVLAVIVGTLVVALLYLQWRTSRVSHDARQTEFAGGTVPSPLPDGSYQGQVRGYTGSWIGKSFDLATGTGVNNFKDGHQLYPFKFYAGHGLSDKIPVLKIDYNVPQNSWWVRHLVDEVVQTSPNHFLGKIHVHIAGLTFSVGYFTLEK